MAGSKYLLDTVIVVGFLNGDAGIRQKLVGADVYVSSITVGELFFGAYRSQQAANNLTRIRRFVDSTSVLDCDVVTSEFYGQIKQRLRAKGRPIPENDIWIGATAMQYGLIVATRDAHFQEIDGLTTDRW